MRLLISAQLLTQTRLRMKSLTASRLMFPRVFNKLRHNKKAAVCVNIHPRKAHTFVQILNVKSRDFWFVLGVC